MKQLLSVSIYSQRFYRQFFTLDLVSMVKTFIIDEREGFFLTVIAYQFSFLIKYFYIEHTNSNLK